jgi:hypothetical protein
MTKRQAQQALLACLIILLTAMSPARLWSRLSETPSTVDEQWLAGQADVIFRGRVSQVSEDPNPPYVNVQGTIDGKPVNYNFIATFQVDRVYRGKLPQEAALHFEYGGPELGGHDCIDFRPGQYWVVFAEIKDGIMMLADDCVGALGVSPLQGPKLEQADWSTQMEADFIAGLADSSQGLRILSLQRLGGLKLASSRPAIHREIEQTSGEERKWAVYAAQRTGDVTVLPEVREYLTAASERELPEMMMAAELQNVTDPTALPDLLNILSTAANDDTKQEVLLDLYRNYHDPRMVPALAVMLSYDNKQLRYNALEGLSKVAMTKECHMFESAPPDGEAAADAVLDQMVAQCKAWWESKGSHEDWSKN